MIPQIKEINFPEYATLSQANVRHADMGERVITSQIKIDGNIKPDFSFNWEIEFKGERYIHPIRTPQALKDNTSICSKIDLVFKHWMMYELQRFFFVLLAPVESGTAVVDKYIASLNLNIVDFIKAFQDVLDYYYKGKIKITLNPDIQYSTEAVHINISYSYIWDVLQQFYDIYKVRWYIEGDTIYVGYPAKEITHVFEYGYEKGLLSTERQVQDDNIRNSLLGRGGSNNLPAYYFKEAPKDSPYSSDPDAIPELANVHFLELRGKTFREYVKGWKAAHYGSEPVENPSEEYLKGFTDTTFDPIEYVKDDASIEKYGLLQGGLDNNDKIYPSIQNVYLDGIGLVNEIVAVEEVVSDDISSSAENGAVVQNVDSLRHTLSLKPNEEKQLSVFFSFEVPQDYNASVFYTSKTEALGYNIDTGEYVQDTNTSFSDVVISIINTNTGELFPQLINIPSGVYTFQATCTTKNNRKATENNFDILFGTINATLTIEGIKLSKSKFLESSEEWKPTFDIWIKNIWQTTKSSNETNEEYALRVWTPILGGDEKEAKITFSSGWLSSSQDWDFLIPKEYYPQYDTSKSINGIPSHWKITLQKSEAEFKATGKYIPNMGMNATAGDTFFFTGIDMPYQYVLWAEERVDSWKRDSLSPITDIIPAWVAKLDKVRINTLESGDSDLLFNQIEAGAQIHLSDKRFIDTPYVDLYIQSISYDYNDSIIPDLEIVLSDKVQVVKNPVTTLQGDIENLSMQVAGLSNIQQLIRQVGDVLYLRKDGFPDISNSPTSFNSKVDSLDFRAGLLGGKGWGIYKDGYGNTIAEFDKVYARQEFNTNTIVSRQTTYVGGLQINSAADIECTDVVENDDSYKCFFDQKLGSVVNLFHLDDVALCQRFNAENSGIKFYKRKVIGVGENYIILSKTIANGAGIPSKGDTIIHYGNYTDKERQYVIIRDVIGGGYERMLSDLDSVNATGVEYFFAGRINGGKPRWFVGNKDEEYAEWVDGKLKIKGTLEVGSDVGGATVVDGGLVTAETISLGSEGNIKAGTTGKGNSDEDIRFWAGATFDKRANAPFRVNQKGQVVMTDANVSGTVNATNGVFKGSLAFKFQELPQGDEVLLSFESGFNFAGVEAWDGNGNPYKTLVLPSRDTAYNGVKCTIINNGFGYSVNGENSYPCKYFKVKTQNNIAFLHNSMNRYADSDITEVWIEAGRVVTFTATILNGVVRWVIENEDGLKPIQANANVLRGNGMPQPYVFWVGEIDTQKDAAGFYQTPYSFMGYSDDIDVKMDSITSKFNVTFRTEMSDDWIYVPQITSMGATTFSIEDKSNSGFNIRMNGKIQLTILMLRSTIIL